MAAHREKKLYGCGIGRSFEEYAHLDVVSVGAADGAQATKISTWIFNDLNLTY